MAGWTLCTRQTTQSLLQHTNRPLLSIPLLERRTSYHGSNLSWSAAHGVWPPHVSPTSPLHPRGMSSHSSGSSSNNPYRILNVPINSNYDTVKTAFLKAALQHHPDHSKHAESAAAFIRIRKAFEEIVHGLNGESSESESKKATTNTTWRADEEFQAWFRQATGEFLAFDMNHDTRQEVIRTYRTMSMGGKHKGGYWELARQLAEREDIAVRNGTRDSKTGTSSDTSQGVPPRVCPSTNLRRKRNR